MDRIAVKNWDDALRCVVQVGWFNSESDRGCFGTGVIVNERQVLTADHVFLGCKERGHVAAFRLDPAFTPGAWSVKHRLALQFTSRTDRDLCVLDFSEDFTTGRAHEIEPAMAIATNGVEPRGSIVDAYGCPPVHLSSESSKTEIMLAGMLHLRRHVIDAAEHEIVVSYPNPHGMSGGPLFNRFGALVGIASRSGTSDHHSEGVANVGYSRYAGVADLLETGQPPVLMDASARPPTRQELGAAPRRRSR